MDPFSILVILCVGCSFSFSIVAWLRVQLYGSGHYTLQSSDYYDWA
jgi:hypothetical protein